MCRVERDTKKQSDYDYVNALIDLLFSYRAGFRDYEVHVILPCIQPESCPL